ncbi:MAG: hypothetical protein LBL59_12130 [Xanthomonadaceae bacterium]|jgi:hypothetical protein|nr:hypothetical protein [Xanthomonadaceae bacterium]
MHPRFFPFGTSRLYAIFSPRKPRHLVLRALFAMMGLVLLSILLFFGIFVGGAMVVGGLVHRAFNKQRNGTVAPSDPNIVDGEYRVVREKPALPLSH